MKSHVRSEGTSGLRQTDADFALTTVTSVESREQSSRIFGNSHAF